MQRDKKNNKINQFSICTDLLEIVGTDSGVSIGHIVVGLVYDLAVELFLMQGMDNNLTVREIRGVINHYDVLDRTPAWCGDIDTVYSIPLL